MLKRAREWFSLLRVGTLKVRKMLRVGDDAGGNAGIEGIYFGSATWDAGSLVDAAGESKDVTVTGAALGDVCVASMGVDISGMTISAHVKSAGVVTVRLQNESGGTLDLASTTVRVLAIRGAANAV